MYRIVVRKPFECVGSIGKPVKLEAAKIIRIWFGDSAPHMLWFFSEAGECLANAKITTKVIEGSRRYLEITAEGKEPFAFPVELLYDEYSTWTTYAVKAKANRKLDMSNWELLHMAIDGDVDEVVNKRKHKVVKTYDLPKNTGITKINTVFEQDRREFVYIAKYPFVIPGKAVSRTIMLPPKVVDFIFS